ILKGSSFDGLLKVTLICEDNQLPYYITPIRIFANEKLEAKIPDLTTSKYVVGDCKISSAIVSSEGNNVEERISDNFKITNELNISLAISEQYLPGDEIVFQGVLKDKNGNNVKDASLILNFNDGDYNVQIKNGEFKYPIKTPPTISSGPHYISTFVEDTYGNKADGIFQVRIIPKPTLIEIRMDKQSFLPGDSTQITIKLTDQAKEPINDTFKVVIKSPRGNDVYSDSVMSGSLLEYKFDNYAEPGKYNIKAEKNGVYSNAEINLSAVKKLAVSINENVLSIKNIGNVRFEESLKIILSSAKKDYKITKKLILIPGEVIDIDLSKEVHSDTYDIEVLPNEDGFRVVYDEPMGSKDMIKGDIIEDNRPFYKKLMDNINGVTGGVIGLKDSVTSPFYLLIILIFIILITIYLHKRYFMEYRLLEKHPYPKKKEISKMLDVAFNKKK
ncbi:MAG: hypothetical protein AABY14_04405, partial [Nanoarchaeota archaeon]